MRAEKASANSAAGADGKPPRGSSERKSKSEGASKECKGGEEEEIGRKEEVYQGCKGEEEEGASGEEEEGRKAQGEDYQGEKDAKDGHQAKVERFDVGDVFWQRRVEEQQPRQRWPRWRDAKRVPLASE